MTRKNSFLIMIVFSVLMLVLLSGGTLFGKAAGFAASVHLPLVSGPAPVPPTWIGPDGGYIIAVAIAPSRTGTIYAGTWGSGVFKSTDGGATWAWMSQGLQHTQINSLAVDPENPDIVYTGTYRGKLYKSVDGAQSWFLSSNNIQDRAIVYTIAIDPQDSENIYIGTRGTSNNGNPPWRGILYRSTDAGNNWQEMLTDIGGTKQRDWVYSIALHPEYPNLVYAATHEHGIYRSTDKARHWEPINDGITNFSTRAVVVNPNSSQTNAVLYTGVWTLGGVFRSNNGGDNWFLTSDSSTGLQIYSMSIDPQDSVNVYASAFTGGVLKTSDGGNSWHVIGLDDQQVTCTAIDPTFPVRLFSGTYGEGLYKSIDAGENWQLSQEGLHATRVSALQVSPLDPQRLFAGVYGNGVLHSLDRGTTWDVLGKDLGDKHVLGVVLSPQNNNFLFALTETDGLYRCDTAGTCWEQIPIHFPQKVRAQPAFASDHPFVQPPFWEDELDGPLATDASPALLDLAFAPSDPQVAYLGTSGGGVYRSTNAGATWKYVGLDLGKILSIAVDHQNPDRLFVAVPEPDRVLLSLDGGASWANINFPAITIYTLELDAAGALYAGTSNGVYQYTQQGWTNLGLPGVAVTALRTHPTETGRLYAGTANGLYTSPDAGISWTAGPDQLLGLTIESISFDPSSSIWVYISTATHGVLRIQN